MERRAENEKSELSDFVQHCRISHERVENERPPTQTDFQTKILKYHRLKQYVSKIEGGTHPKTVDEELSLIHI